MKLTLPKIRIIAISVVAAILVFSLGFWSGKSNIRVAYDKSKQKVNISREIPKQYKDVDFKLFWEVWDKLEASYFDKSKLEPDKMVYGAISGMVAALGDPYTVFLPPDDQKRSQEDLGGEFEGVGIQIGFKGTQLAVTAPLEGSPASAVGVKAGDFIIGIKDEVKGIDRGTSGISLQEAVSIIRGPAGTKVKLILVREGEEKPIEVEIVRTKIEVPSVVLNFVGDNKDVAHLKLLKFGEQTNKEWDEAVTKIRVEKPKAVVLDLRNNPGGFLNGAVFIASEFLKSGTAVMRENGQGRRQELTVLGKPKLLDNKLIVLVNKGSASASEIVAGALKDHNRAQIVGEKTFGKGTIQESLELDDTGLHITTEKWLTPKGTWVHGEGLEPNIIIEDNADTEEDEQLLKALELLR